jgi:hypothetical protein
MTLGERCSYSEKVKRGFFTFASKEAMDRVLEKFGKIRF